MIISYWYADAQKYTEAKSSVYLCVLKYTIHKCAVFQASEHWEILREVPQLDAYF